MTYDFKIKLTYSFAVIPTIVLNGDYSSVYVLGVIDFETASKYADVQALHVNVYPYLDPTTPNDATAYSYLLFKTPNGITSALGLPWIREETIVLKEARTIRVTIGDASTPDVQRVRDALVQNGFNNLKIEIN